MNEYVAIVRVRPPAEGGPLPGFAAAAHACRENVSGVSETLIDAGTHSVQVHFDRSRASVADIVRCLEDHGITVTAVAQTKVDAGVHAATA